MIRKNTIQLARLAIFAAIMFVLAATPLGHIQLPFVKATTIHIPVIIGAILFGPKFGGILGFFFGCTSLVTSTLSPNLTSFAFSPFIPVPGSDQGSLLALLIAFVPRILIGVATGALYRVLSKHIKSKLACPISALAGSMINTVLVLGGIYLFFAKEYAAAKGIMLDQLFRLLLGVAAVNGIAEAIAAALISSAVVYGVRKNFNL